MEWALPCLVTMYKHLSFDPFLIRLPPHRWEDGLHSSPTEPTCGTRCPECRQRCCAHLASEGELDRSKPCSCVCGASWNAFGPTIPASLEERLVLNAPVERPDYHAEDFDDLVTMHLCDWLVPKAPQ